MRQRSPYAQLIRALVIGALTPTVACGGGVAPSSNARPTDDGGGVVPEDAGDKKDAGGNDASAALRPGFTRLSCGEGSSTTKLAALSATPPFDYLELREEDGYKPKTSPDTLLEKLGTLCKTATNATTCASTFQGTNHPVDLACGVPYPCTVQYLATTRGDEVRTFVAGRDDLGKVAAPIETIDEAALVVGWMRPLTCSNGSFRETSDGFDIAYTYSTDRCTSGKSELHDVVVHITRDDGVVTLISDDITPLPIDPNVGCASARRAAGVVYALPAMIKDVGDWLAGAAHLEAASVASFTRLARELRAHGAPDALVARAIRAARDERHHAQRLRRLARQMGKRVTPVPRIAREVRSLEAVAVENAVEGASRETWGAVVVAHQAACAASPELRATFDAIATDEAEHAELAVDVATWLASRLPADANARVSIAHRGAIASLACEAIGAIPEVVRIPLGLPSQAVAARLFEGARSALFSAQRAAA